MNADQHFFLKFFDNLCKTLQYFAKSSRQINIFRPVQRDQKIIKRFYRKILKCRTAFNFLPENIQNFLNRISRNKNPFTLNSLAHKIFLTSFGIRQQKSAGVVNYTAIYFLRDAIVITAISRLHMKNRDSAPRRDDCRKSTVRIA